LSGLTLDSVCAASEDIVVREIEGELILIPLVSGIADAEDELYSLNPTGQAIWQRLDGQRTLKEVAALLAAEFEASPAELETDVVGLASELVGRRLLVVQG
jgi:hypothetical protein